jgi:hypothetical protein
MQLVVARVAAATIVVSEASTWTSLETARQLAEDRATTAQTVVTAAATERDSLASRLALAEAEVEKLCTAAASTEEVAERARTTATTTETAARDAAQAAAREKATLEARVLEQECDLGIATTDLATAGASSPRSATSFRRPPRRLHGCARAMQSCRRTSRVSRVVAFLLRIPRCLFLVVF